MNLKNQIRDATGQIEVMNQLVKEYDTFKKLKQEIEEVQAVSINFDI